MPSSRRPRPATVVCRASSAYRSSCFSHVLLVRLPALSPRFTSQPTRRRLPSFHLVLEPPPAQPATSPLICVPLRLPPPTKPKSPALRLRLHLPCQPFLSLSSFTFLANTRHGLSCPRFTHYHPLLSHPTHSTHASTSLTSTCLSLPYHLFHQYPVITLRMGP